MRTLILAAALLAATPALADVKMAEPAIGCVDRDTAELVEKLLLQGDTAALDELALPHIIRGTCVPLRQGIEVILMDVRWSGSTAQVRQPGSAQLLWVPDRALDLGE